MSASRFARVLLAAWLVALPPGAAAQSSTKPLLSKEIHSVFEKSGADAARRRYDVIEAKHQDEYTFDLQGLMEVATAYTQAGDVESARVIFEILQRVSELEMKRSPVLGGLTAMLDSAAREDSARAAAEPERPVRQAVPVDLGPSRTDLARFFGVYGNPAEQRTPRNVFVTQRCDGRLMFGAMWGDVTPWTMRSLGDTRFIQAWKTYEAEELIRLDFHLDGARKATALTHTLTFGKGPVRVQRLGDLPDGWEKCISFERE
jgi:hypothetical protein